MAESRFAGRGIGGAASYDAGTGDRFDVGPAASSGGGGGSGLATGRFARVDDSDALPLNPTVANWPNATLLTNDVGVNDTTTYIGGLDKRYVKLLINLGAAQLCGSWTSTAYFEAGSFIVYWWDGGAWVQWGVFGMPANFNHVWNNLSNNPADITTQYLCVVLQDDKFNDPNYDARIGDFRVS